MADLPPPLDWLLDEASASPGAGPFLEDLGRRLWSDGFPVTGGALSVASSHPVVARRAWLWRAGTGEVIEVLGFGDEALSDQADKWLAEQGPIHRQAIGAAFQNAVLAWAGTRSFVTSEIERLDEVARFATAPIAALIARMTLSALLEAYLGRRSAAQVEAGALRRGGGECIRAALLYADLRDFTAMSEAADPGVVTASLDAWFDRIAGASHAFGGEVLKFIGDGILVIFPVTGTPGEACDAALRAVRAARAGMMHLDEQRRRKGLPPLPFGAALHIGDVIWGNIGASNRLDFTAIGPAVNLVSRLEGLCRPLGRSILISGALATQTSSSLVALGDHTLRGIAAPCAVFTLPEA